MRCTLILDPAFQRGFRLSTFGNQAVVLSEDAVSALPSAKSPRLAGPGHLRQEQGETNNRAHNAQHPQTLRLPIPNPLATRETAHLSLCRYLREI